MTFMPAISHRFDPTAVSQGEPRHHIPNHENGSFDKLFRHELAKLTVDSNRMSHGRAFSPDRFNGPWMHHLHEIAATETPESENTATESEDGKDTLAEIKRIVTKALDVLAARIERVLGRAGVDGDEMEHLTESVIADLRARLDQGLEELDAAEDPAAAARELLNSAFDQAAHDLQHELRDHDFGRWETMHVVGGAFRGILPRANAALDAVEGGDQRRQVVERIVDRRIDRMEARVERALGFLGFDAAEIERITGSVFGGVTERIDAAITELPEDASPFHVARHVVRDIAAGIRQEIAMALVVEDGDEEPAPVTAEAETDDPAAPADEPATQTADADATTETELDPAA